MHAYTSISQKSTSPTCTCNCMTRFSRNKWHCKQECNFHVIRTLTPSTAVPRASASGALAQLTPSPPTPTPLEATAAVTHTLISSLQVLAAAARVGARARRGRARAARRLPAARAPPARRLWGANLSTLPWIELATALGGSDDWWAIALVHRWRITYSYVVLLRCLLPLLCCAVLCSREKHDVLSDLVFQFRFLFYTYS